jgi:hypothetical protein
VDFLAVKSKSHNQWLHTIAGESEPLLQIDESHQPFLLITEFDAEAEAGRSRAGSSFSTYPATADMIDPTIVRKKEPA